MFFFTDGLTDASCTRGEQFGIERLQVFCSENRFARSTEFLEKAFATVDGFSAGSEQQDDMTATLFHLAE